MPKQGRTKMVTPFAAKKLLQKFCTKMVTKETKKIGLSYNSSRRVKGFIHPKTVK